MKHAAFKVQPGKGGWIETTVAPIHQRQMVTFRKGDMLLLMALVTVVVAVARVFIAR